MTTTAAATIELTLVSHTNAGKTTLVRTLLGRDVGEVRDAPHVTELAEPHELLRTAHGDVLRLWDTPGFGDSARLVGRLRHADDPLGWFLHQLWDRHLDRPMWCSQQAVRAARAASDMVLYLVNAAEDPRDAGYIAAEMQVLRWIGKPVLVLLNQTGPPQPAAQELAQAERWRLHLAPFGLVQDVLALDAFARCWVQERVLLETVARGLDGARRAALDRLIEDWTARGVARFDAAMAALAEQLAQAACDSEPVAAEQAGPAGGSGAPGTSATATAVRSDAAAPSGAGSAAAAVGKANTPAPPDVKGGPVSAVRRWLQAAGGGQRDRAEAARAGAMERLAERLDTGVRANTDRLIALHGLAGSAGPQVLARVREHFAAPAQVDEGRAALWGSVLTGALAGLKADLVSGGLTLGGGMLVGGLIGGLTGAGVARGFNRLAAGERPMVRWSDEFLDGLARSSVLRYLAVAHFGRGRGKYVEAEAPAFWRAEVDQGFAIHGAQLHALWQRAREVRADPDPELFAELQRVVARIATDTLGRLYPGCLPPLLVALRQTDPLPGTLASGPAVPSARGSA